MTGPQPCTDVVAVIVAFHPEQDALIALVRALAPQVRTILVVDNTPGEGDRVRNILSSSGAANVELHSMGRNLGIGKALNVGIGLAIEAGARSVLLSDQDSLPMPDMVAALLGTSAGLLAQGIKVGAVAPTFNDSNTGITFPFQAEVARRFFYGHRHTSESEPVVEALTLITSGMLVPVEVFADAGLMREDLFIDHVDIEWSHRARARGWRLFGTWSARMQHHMGEDALRVWYFGWRRESAYGPLRMYYRIRNFLLICRSPNIGWRWKVRNGWYWLGFVYSHVVFGRERMDCLRMALRGFVDGLRGAVGPWRGGG